VGRPGWGGFPHRAPLLRLFRGRGARLGFGAKRGPLWGSEAGWGRPTGVLLPDRGALRGSGTQPGRPAQESLPSRGPLPGRKESLPGENPPKNACRGENPPKKAHRRKPRPGGPGRTVARHYGHFETRPRVARVAATLVDWLATRSPRELAVLLSRRPEARQAPLPRDLTEVAERLGSATAVTSTLHRLPLPALQLIELLQLFGPDG